MPVMADACLSEFDSVDTVDSLFHPIYRPSIMPPRTSNGKQMYMDLYTLDLELAKAEIEERDRLSRSEGIQAVGSVRGVSELKLLRSQSMANRSILMSMRQLMLYIEYLEAQLLSMAEAAENGQVVSATSHDLREEFQKMKSKTLKEGLLVVWSIKFPKLYRS